MLILIRVKLFSSKLLNDFPLCVETMKKFYYLHQNVHIQTLIDKPTNHANEQSIEVVCIFKKIADYIYLIFKDLDSIYDETIDAYKILNENTKSVKFKIQCLQKAWIGNCYFVNALA